MIDEDWDKDLAVNLNGQFFLCRAGLPELVETGGNIVNVASIAGIEGEGAPPDPASRPPRQYRSGRATMQSSRSLQ